METTGNTFDTLYLNPGPKNHVNFVLVGYTFTGSLSGHGDRFFLQGDGRGLS